MRVRSFTIPFSEIVGAEATELDFDPATDFLVLRSIFAIPTTDVREIGERIVAATDGLNAEQSDALVLDLLKWCIVEWHLIGVDGTPTSKPTTPEQLNALPGAIRGALFPYLSSFRGKGPDPTPAA